MKDIFLILVILLVSIYTLSFAKYELKEKRFASAAFSTLLVITSAVLFVLRQI